MEKVLLLMLGFVISVQICGQDISQGDRYKDQGLFPDATETDHEQAGYPIAGFALSFNPVGIFQYGPMINAEFGLARNLVFHTHIRFLGFGLLSERESGYNEFTEALGHIALGGGPLYFFGTRPGKPYLGVILDCSSSGPPNHANNHTFQPSSVLSMMYMLNTGYRIRFPHGFFVNGGGFVGISSQTWRWNTMDTNNPGYERQMKLVFMAELTFGYEF
jgi:hypothetical protein